MKKRDELINDAKRKVCFVVGPIGSEDSPTRIHADWVLEGIIRPVFSENFVDFDVVRSDTMPIPGMIDAQMINHLLDAELVIADMSERNPNAFYEIGIRHMAGKPIVHMFAKGTDIPFDVTAHRAIPFSIATVQGQAAARSSLFAAVKEALKPGYQVENPVTRARGVQKLEETATPEYKLLWDEMTALRQQLAWISSAAVRSVHQDSVSQAEQSFHRPLGDLAPSYTFHVHFADTLRSETFDRLISYFAEINLAPAVVQIGERDVLVTLPKHEPLETSLFFKHLLDANLPQTVSSMIPRRSRGT